MLEANLALPPVLQFIYILLSPCNSVYFVDNSTKLISLAP
jgi:hypothetical protein